MPRKNRIIKHQPYSFDRLICDKKRYRDDKEAQKAAELQMLENVNLDLSIYKCDLCGYWHLTRNAKK